MSQTVPNYAGSGQQELSSSLAELDFSILSDYEVPSPGSLPQLERSPPHLFGSPQRDASEFDCGYASPPYAGAPLSPPLKQEVPLSPPMKQEMQMKQEMPNVIKQELESPFGLESSLEDCGYAAASSPQSDGGYSSAGGSPGYQPASPPPEDHQLLRQCLRDNTLQRQLNRPVFSLDMLYAADQLQHQQQQQQQQQQQHEQQQQQDQQTGNWMMDQLDSVFDLALEQIRQEKKNVCRLLGISPGM